MFYNNKSIDMSLIYNYNQLIKDYELVYKKYTDFGLDNKSHPFHKTTSDFQENDLPAHDKYYPNTIKKYCSGEIGDYQLASICEGLEYNMKLMNNGISWVNDHESNQNNTVKL